MRIYYKVWKTLITVCQVLLSLTDFITKWVRYYKVRLNNVTKKGSLYIVWNFNFIQNIIYRDKSEAEIFDFDLYLRSTLGGGILIFHNFSFSICFCCFNSVVLIILYLIVFPVLNYCILLKTLEMLQNVKKGMMWLWWENKCLTNNDYIRRDWKIKTNGEKMYYETFMDLLLKKYFQVKSGKIR